MGPERKEQLQSPREFEATLQEASALVGNSERLVRQLTELLACATELLEKQRAILANIQARRH